MGQQLKSKNKLSSESIDTPTASTALKSTETVISSAEPQPADPESVKNGSDDVDSQVSKNSCAVTQNVQLHLCSFIHNISSASNSKFKSDMHLHHLILFKMIFIVFYSAELF